MSILKSVLWIFFMDVFNPLSYFHLLNNPLTSNFLLIYNFVYIHTFSFKFVTKCNCCEWLTVNFIKHCHGYLRFRDWIPMTKNQFKLRMKVYSNFIKIEPLERTRTFLYKIYFCSVQRNGNNFIWKHFLITLLEKSSSEIKSVCILKIYRNLSNKTFYPYSINDWIYLWKASMFKKTKIGEICFPFM